jgi:hypothetical protein
MFFVSLDETMDKDHELNGTSLLFSESASNDAVLIYSHPCDTPLICSRNSSIVIEHAILM